MTGAYLFLAAAFLVFLLGADVGITFRYDNHAEITVDYLLFHFHFSTKGNAKAESSLKKQRRKKKRSLPPVRVIRKAADLLLAGTGITIYRLSLSEKAQSTLLRVLPPPLYAFVYGGVAAGEAVLLSFVAAHVRSLDFFENPYDDNNVSFFASVSLVRIIACALILLTGLIGKKIGENGVAYE